MNVQSFTVVLTNERQSIIQHEIPLNKEFVFQIQLPPVTALWLLT